MIRAVLSNPSHPEYGVATIPFPIPHEQYAHCMELLAALEIGDAVKADCKVEKIDSFYTVLKRTEMLTVNVEELNYLAKRLDSFDIHVKVGRPVNLQKFLKGDFKNHETQEAAWRSSYVADAGDGGRIAPDVRICSGRGWRWQFGRYRKCF